MNRRSGVAILLVAIVVSSVWADYTLPPLDITVDLASLVPLDTSGVPADTYIAAAVTVNWTPLATNSLSDRATWALRVQGGDPDDPDNWFAEAYMAVDSLPDDSEVQLHYYVHFDQPYDGSVPLEIVAKQALGGGADWKDVTITLLTSSPVPPAMEYLSIGTIAPGESIDGDNTGSLTSLYGKNEVRRDGPHEYFGGRDHMGWEDAGDDVYTIDWPGGDFQLDLTVFPDGGDLDLFLWGNQTECVGWSYSFDGDEQIRIRNLPAGTYYAHVDGWQGIESPYTITLTQGYDEPYIYYYPRNTFNNFSAGDTYREGHQLNGLVISYEPPPYEEGWDQGPRIVATRSGYLTQVVAALHMSAWDDDNVAEIWVCANDTSDPAYPIGKPGEVLETVMCKEEMEIASFPETTAPIYYPASGETYLLAGEVYWLIASTPGPHDSDLTWARNNRWSTGLPGTVGDYAAREAPTDAWMIRTNYDYPLPACRLEVSYRIPSTIPGDIDLDEDVDADDLELMLNCIAGPDVTSAPAGVLLSHFVKSDLDHDGDADLADFADFQTAY